MDGLGVSVIISYRLADCLSHAHPHRYGFPSFLVCVWRGWCVHAVTRESEASGGWCLRCNCMVECLSVCLSVCSFVRSFRPLADFFPWERGVSLVGCWLVGVQTDGSDERMCLAAPCAYVFMYVWVGMCVCICV